MPHYQKFYVYLMTNRNRTVLYLGFTSDLMTRVNEHDKGLREGSSKRYRCRYLIYFERFKYVHNAIRREKEIKNGVERKSFLLLIHQILNGYS